MRLDEWQRELSSVARDLGRVAAYFGQSGRDVNQLAQRKVQLVQSQLRFERICDEMQKLLERNFLLVPQEKAILHWSRIYLEKVKTYCQMRQKMMTRGLWLKLLRARMLDGEPTEQLLTREPDAEDLVTLALKHAQLQRTEHQLKSEMKALATQKAALHARYERLGILEANQMAAGSLQGLSDPGSEREKGSSPLSTLGIVLKKASWRRTEDAVSRDFWGQLGTYVRAAEETIGQCQRLTLANLRPEGQGVPKNDEGSLTVAIQRLTKLDQEVQRLYDKMMVLPLKALHPIVMQKSKKTDKREASSIEAGIH